MFDFDRVIERRGTHASKWDNIAKLSGITSPDAIPMWVADMDFAAPPGVTAALTAEVQRATHGYYADTGSWAEALRRLDEAPPRSADRSGAGSARRPGIVSGLGLILQAVSAPGDEVVVFPPAYHAFRRIIARQRAAHPRCAACRAEWPLRHGPRCACAASSRRGPRSFSCAARTIPAAPCWSAGRASRAWPHSAPSTT